MVWAISGGAGFLGLHLARRLLANGHEVLRALEAKTYDLVLLDVQMPEMDGYEAARRICTKWVGREDERPRIVAMTGNAMQGDREKCLEAGMDDFLTKPIRADDLRAALLATPARRAALVTAA